MSRSVWTHSDSLETVFFALEFDEDDSDFVWSDLMEDIRETLKAKFPSFENANSWPERESYCLLENDYAQIVLSEYCGLVSLGVVPYVNSDYNDYRENFGPAWCSKNVAPFLRKTWGRLRHIATASNGEAFFERIQ